MAHDRLTLAVACAAVVVDDVDGEDEDVALLGVAWPDMFDVAALLGTGPDLLFAETVFAAELVEFEADDEEAEETVDDDEAGVDVAHSALKLELAE